MRQLSKITPVSIELTRDTFEDRVYWCAKMTGMRIGNHDRLIMDFDDWILKVRQEFGSGPSLVWCNGSHVGLTYFGKEASVERETRGITICLTAN